MLLVRRYLAMAALFFWQGGFVFYASVVVPIGQSTVGPGEQASITQQVTDWLNVSGAVALAPLLWECRATRDPGRWRYWGRIALVVVLTITLAALFWLHYLLDHVLAGTGSSMEFRPLHRLYLWTHTIQWLAAIIYLGMSLAAWRAEDRKREDTIPKPQRRDDPDGPGAGASAL